MTPGDLGQMADDSLASGASPGEATADDAFPEFLVDMELPEQEPIPMDIVESELSAGFARREREEEEELFAPTTFDEFFEMGLQAAKEHDKKAVREQIERRREAWKEARMMEERAAKWRAEEEREEAAKAARKEKERTEAAWQAERERGKKEAEERERREREKRDREEEEEERVARIREDKIRREELEEEERKEREEERRKKAEERRRSPIRWSDAPQEREEEGRVQEKSKEERRMERKRKWAEEEDIPYESGATHLSIFVKDKKTQTEMTKEAAMRREEVRHRARRSGRNPQADDNWEGAGERERVTIVKWEELRSQQRRDIIRAQEGKFKKKKLTGSQRQAKRAALQKHARAELESGGLHQDSYPTDHEKTATDSTPAAPETTPTDCR